MKQTDQQIMERTVLGTILINGMLYNDATGIITEKTFTNDKNRLVFEAMQQLSAKMRDIDMVTVHGQLEQTGSLSAIGGFAYLSELTSNIVIGDAFKEKCLMMAEHHASRTGIQRASEISMTGGIDPFERMELLYQAADEMNDILNPQAINDRIAKDAAVEELKRITKIKQQGIIGIRTPFNKLDYHTSGWQNGNLIIVAGRPGMGKTSLALNILLTAAEQGPVAMSSMEMSEAELLQRVMAIRSGVSLWKIKKNAFKGNDLDKLTAAVEALPTFYINDSAKQSINSLSSWAKRMVKRKGCRMLVIDYLQLMGGSTKRNGNREQEIAEISRGMKIIAKELNIPVICLSQLNRSVETRGGDKKPQLSDLRESGSIEQDADIVMFPHRPEYYNIMQDEAGNDLRGKANIIIAKHRSGSTGEFTVDWNGETTSFVDADPINDYTESPF